MVLFPFILEHAFELLWIEHAFVRRLRAYLIEVRKADVGLHHSEHSLGHARFHPRVRFEYLRYEAFGCRSKRSGTGKQEPRIAALH